jgi:hypothetical protein
LRRRCNMPRKTKETPVEAPFYQQGSTVDLDKARAQLEEMTSQKVRRDKLATDSVRYVPNYRRIAPQVGQMSDWYQIVSTHFGVGPGNRSIVCLKEMKLGDSCPVCDFGWEIYHQGDKHAAGQILPSWRIYCNVVKLNQDGTVADENPYVLSLNQTQFASLTDEFERYGDLTHLETGRNIEISAKEQKRGEFKFNELKFRISDPVAFPGDSGILANAYDLTEITPVVTPEEMVAMLTGDVSGPALAAGPGSFGLLPSPAAETEELVQVEQQAQEAAPTVPAGGFGEDNAAPEAQVEAQPAPTDSKASGPPPQTDPSAALARLKERYQNGGKGNGGS